MLHYVEKAAVERNSIEYDGALPRVFWWLVLVRCPPAAPEV